MTQEDQAPIHAVIGATGQQGGAVVHALLARGASVRAIARDPATEAAKRLRARGVEVVQADQEDPDALRSALQGVAGLSAMTTFAGRDGVDGEVRRGRAVGDAAAAAQVPLVVYSSVGGAERDSGVPHFESKRQVELHLLEVLPTVRIVRPTYFMENLEQALSGDGASADPFVLQMPLPADVPLQMIAVRDIGAVIAAVLTHPATLAELAIEIGGDERTPAQISAAIGRHLGRPARFEETPIESLPDHDLQHMFRWLAESPAYDADFAGTKQLDKSLVNLDRWLNTRQ